MIAESSQKYEPLKMPSGKWNPRQKELWRLVTAEIQPGMIAAGAETLLLARLIKTMWRCEFLELELEEILEQSQTACVLGGNQQVTTHPVFTQLERATSTAANLSQKLKLCPAARLESKAAITGKLGEPIKIREPSDLLFGGAAPYTREEKARWTAEGALKDFDISGFPGYDNDRKRLLA